MSPQYEVGDEVSFYGGVGSVVDIRSNGEGKLLQVLTTDGDLKEVSPSLPMVRKLSEAEEGDVVELLGGEAKVVATEEREGESDLLYLHTEEGDFKKIPEDCTGLTPGRSISERLASGEFDDPLRFRLRERAARLNLAYRSDRFLSLSGNRIRIEPYQVDAAHEVLDSYEPRYLIADEVGLGKTIEAGIIIEELIARDRADRVLIVTPASLRDQWQAEMRDKFGREYVAFDRDLVRAKRRGTSGTNVWKTEDKIVVSIDFAKQDDMLDELRALDEEWDVAVFDEAHHLTAREGTDGIDRVDRYRVGEAVAENSEALLMLTGTPHKGKPDQFYHMLRLLDPYRFRGPDEITPEKLEDLMIRRVKTDDSMIDADGTPMFPGREIQTLGVDFTPEERQLYDDLTEYISAVYTASSKTDSNAAGFTKVVYQKRLVSSIPAIRESLQSRLDGLDQKVRIDESVADRLDTVDESARTEADVLEQLIDAADSIDVDSKGNRLRTFLDGIFEQEPDEKVLIFTEYTDTLEYLREEVLEGISTAEIHGGMSQENRRQQIEKFRTEANVMLATDAAREGLNLQFAHIMVNYDLPWNPIRIDQRMGRLHRYGQDETVKIYNLFIRNTRESEILDLLISKIDQIESDLGMRSDVLGTVLDDYDVEGAIMDAVTGERDSTAVIDDIESAIEERKDAVKRIEEQFLIRDKFDRDSLSEIEDIIDLSEERPIGEDDIEQLVRQFCIQFGGDVRNASPGPEPDEHPLYRIEVPDILSLNSEVKDMYAPVTFARETALEKPRAELISLNHSLVQQIVEYCLDGDWIDGQAAVLTSGNSEITPGVLATYRTGYVSGEGELPTEDYVRVYIDKNGTVHESTPSISGALPPELGTENPGCQMIAEGVQDLLKTARDEARDVVEERVEEVQEERQEDIDIKEKHARKYFQEQIREQEERLKEYQKKQRETDKDMQIAIRGAESELEELEEEWEAEQARLERERTIIPDEPELVNVAIITAQVPAVDLERLSEVTIPECLQAAADGDSCSAVEFVPGYQELESNVALCEQGKPRLFRASEVFSEESSPEQVELGETDLWVDGTVTLEEASPSEIDRFQTRIQQLFDRFEGTRGIDLGVCFSSRPVDGVLHDGTLLVNAGLQDEVSDQYWAIIIARELAIADRKTPTERQYDRMIELLDAADIESL